MIMFILFIFSIFEFTLRFDDAFMSYASHEIMTSGVYETWVASQIEQIPILLMLWLLIKIELS